MTHASGSRLVLGTTAFVLSLLTIRPGIGADPTGYGSELSAAPASADESTYSTEDYRRALPPMPPPYYPAQEQRAAWREGHPHYHCPQRYYSTWYRSKAFGLGLAERRTPDPWRPRGYGNMFARPHTCYRMDYHPYHLQEQYSQYGPSYLRRLDSYGWYVDDAKCYETEECNVRPVR